MGTSDITVRPYNGTLASLNLGGLINQNVLNAIGGTQGATITDDDGVLDTGDNGQATFSLDGSTESDPITYLGSGTISLVSALGIRLFPRDISIFQAGGQIYFYLPEGLPPLDLVTLSIEIDADTPLTLPDFVPCFAAGTRIATRRGSIPVEQVKPGDMVVASDGRQHRVLWVGSKRINLAALCDDHYRKLVPVRIRAEALGAHPPYADLVVSQQHRIVLRHPMTETMFGLGDCFVPAVTLVGYLAEFATDITEISYHHILCAEHVTLFANGVEAESLFMGDLLTSGMRPALRDEIALVFPEIVEKAEKGVRATQLPTLKAYEARLIANLIAGPARSRSVPTRPTPDRRTRDDLQCACHGHLH